MPSVPKRLKIEPLIEAIWQMQFDPASDQPIGDILPGVLYSALKAHYPGLRHQRLPIADIPMDIAQFDPILRFAAKYRLEEPGSPFLFQTGDRVVTVNCLKPYSGWDAFKKKIIQLIGLAKQSGLVPPPRRHSLRYIDLLTLDQTPDLGALQFSIVLGQEKRDCLPLQMRLELPEGGFTHIVQIAAPAEAGPANDRRTGTIVDIETFVTVPSDGWDDLEAQVELLHERSKALFFQKLLTPEAINRLEPEY
jgi:uncharacterized protein (TIGR04255 family)